MRAVVYARYSSENQREASIADLAEIGRRYASAQGWAELNPPRDLLDGLFLLSSIN
jgi:hypothetical protein